MEEAREIFLPIPGGWGKMGHTHIRLAAASEDVLTDALRTAWKLRTDKNAKASQKTQVGEATTMKATRARNINSNKKDLSPEQRAELLRALKSRFEKNMNRHKGLEWAQVQAKLEANAEKLWSSMKWKELAVNRTLLVMIKRRANTFFMTVQRKVLKAAEVFAMTVKRWTQGRNINQKIARLIWQLPWALRF